MVSVGWLQCRWLLAHGRQEEGKRALAQLSPAAEPDLAQEVAALAAQAQRDLSAQTSAWQALRSPALRSQLCLGSAAASDVRLTGEIGHSWGSLQPLLLKAAGHQRFQRSCGSAALMD